MAEKLYDLVVVTGQFRGSNGEMRNNYETIGAIFQGEKGKFFTLKSTFNPAGMNRDPNRDSIIGNLYRPKNSNPSDAATGSNQNPGSSSMGDDEIPY